MNLYLLFSAKCSYIWEILKFSSNVTRFWITLENDSKESKGTPRSTLLRQGKVKKAFTLSWRNRVMPMYTCKISHTKVFCVRIIHTQTQRRRCIRIKLWYNAEKKYVDLASVCRAEKGVFFIYFFVNLHIVILSLIIKSNHNCSTRRHLGNK